MSSPAKFKTTGAVDFLIVGSGSAGGVLAKELSSNGLQVVVLEQGPRIEPGQFEHDEYWAFNLHALTNNPRQQPTTFRKSENETATIKPTISYGRVVGGGCVHFTTNYWRFHELDFVELSRKGSIPVPVLRTGRSLTMTSNLITRKRSGNLACPAKRAQIRLIHRDRNPILCRHCPSNRRAF
jgi:choline dehydrogenase-like flavoprotein